MLAISAQIWDNKYRLKKLDGTPIDETVEDTWKRVAQALSMAEPPEKRRFWYLSFFETLTQGYFSPAGRIIAGAGSERNVTLSNCFTMGTIPDSMEGIFSMLKEAALTMQAGGGIGYDFSTIRPKGAPVHGVGADASGPLSFMDVWDAMCRTVMSAGSRRGAMMATMRCDHPDIEDFITAKRDPAKLRMFNLSVLVTDAFMAAVKEDRLWRLHFENRRGETLVEKTVSARGLWDKIMESTYAFAEPGVIFIDRVNKDHNLGYLETIATTNPCGEKPMGPYASCLLGSVNLAKMISEAFTPRAALDLTLLDRTVETAIRMMDNVVDVGLFPLPAQRDKAQQDRQLGLGVTGLADALAMLGLTYGSPAAVSFTEKVMSLITQTAYWASVELAKEKSPFPTFNAEEFLHPDRFAGRMLPEDLKESIRKNGIRNGLLISIAPTGTISLFAENVSSGIEPIFALSTERKVLQPDGTRVPNIVEDYAVRAYREWWCSSIGNEPEEWSNDLLPSCFVTAQTLTPEDHVRMQAAAQKWVDSSISKTVNLPKDISFEDFKAVYQLAYDLGCKGCTTYRPNDITGSVLSVAPEAPAPDAPVEEADLLAGTLEDNPAYLRVLDRSGETIAEGSLNDFSFEDWPQGDGVSFTAVMDIDYSATTVALGDTPTDEPQERPEALLGATYKLKWPGSDHALYISIADVVDPVTKARRPFEVFINSKNMDHYAWTVALTRMISAIFRRPHDSRFVVEELKAVFDPKGGAWMGGKFVPSVLAAIGSVIERHMRSIGYLGSVPPASRREKTPEDERAVWGVKTEEQAARIARINADAPLPFVGQPTGPHCQKCSSFNVKNEGGCFTCLDCGESKCG